MLRPGRRTAVGALFVALAILGLGPAVRAHDDVEQGLEYFKTGKYAEAAAKFQTLVHGSPNYDYGYYMLGLAYLKMHKPFEAEPTLLRAIELNGGKFEYHHGLASCYLERKDPAKAIATLLTAEPLAQTDQHRYALYSLRGFAFYSLDKMPEAARDLEKARAIHPQASILVKLGKAYYSLGYAERAVPVFRQALQATPNDAAATELLATALLDLGAEATNDIQKRTYYGEAAQAAEKLIRLQPHGFEGHNLAGRAALGARDFARAELAFRRVLAQRPEYCYAMANLGKAYLAQERWAEAETILREATRCAPRLAVGYETLGFALRNQNKLADALRAYEEAQRIKPSPSVARAIEFCNAAMVRDNAALAEVDKKQQAEAQKAKRAYEEAVRRRHD